MARKTKAEREQERVRAALVRIHLRAQDGTKSIGGELHHARIVVRDLLAPWSGRKHEHAEPFEGEHCGWCSNIHSWRNTVAFLEVAGPHARKLEEQLRDLSLDLSQTALWALVQDRFPRVRRDLARQLWREVRTIQSTEGRRPS